MSVRDEHLSGRGGAVVARRSTRGAVAAVVLLAMGLLGAACTPSPDGSTPSPDLFSGGTYQLGVTIPPQTFSNTFPVFGGLGTCTATATTASVSIPGATLTLAAVQLDLAAGTLTLPGARVDLPRASLSAGTLTLSCFGTVVGTVGFTVEFAGMASVQAATLDVVNRRVTLSAPTLRITDASVAFLGGPTGMRPVPLDPFEVTLPPVQVAL